MGDRKALLIGVGNNPHFSLLHKTAVDLKAMEQVLRLHCGFGQIEILENDACGYADVHKAIIKFLRGDDVRATDQLLLYFTGHGERDFSRGDALFLCLRDTEPGLLHVNGLSCEALKEELVHSYAQARLLILDCCFSGAFAKDVGRAGLERVFDGKGTSVLTSSNERELSHEAAAEKKEQTQPNAASAFTQAVVESIEHFAQSTEEGALSARDVHDLAKSRLQGKQTPCFFGFQEEAPFELAKVFPNYSTLPDEHLNALKATKDHQLVLAVGDIAVLLRQQPQYARAAWHALEPIFDQPEQYSDKLLQKICDLPDSPFSMPKPQASEQSPREPFIKPIPNEPEPSPQPEQQKPEPPQPQAPEQKPREPAHFDQIPDQPVPSSTPEKSESEPPVKKHTRWAFAGIGATVLGVALYAWQPIKPRDDPVQPVTPTSPPSPVTQQTIEQQRTVVVPSSVARQPFEPEMLPIPAGSFTMGCLSNDSDCIDDEKPARTVQVDAFWLAETEVTFAQYDAYAEATNADKPDDQGWGRADRPVINVSWNDAKQYIQWLNKETQRNFRLPSEAEWEYAARAGSKTKYSWGDSIGKNKANCDGCGSQWDNQKTAPVASFAANPWGLHDMHGNVWEWVEDKWHSDYQGAPSTGKAWTDGNSSDRVERGGSWVTNPWYLRSATRVNWHADHSFAFLGFRLAEDR